MNNNLVYRNQLNANETSIEPNATLYLHHNNTTNNYIVIAENQNITQLSKYNMSTQIISKESLNNTNNSTTCTNETSKLQNAPEPMKASDENKTHNKHNNSLFKKVSNNKPASSNIKVNVINKNKQIASINKSLPITPPTEHV